MSEVNIWVLINNSILNILSDLQNASEVSIASTEEGLNSLLESMLQKSDKMSDVLLPPITENILNNNNKNQYFGKTIKN